MKPDDPFIRFDDGKDDIARHRLLLMIPPWGEMLLFKIERSILNTWIRVITEASDGL